MNLHTPERQADETVEDYKARRAASKAAARAITAHGFGNQRKLPSSREKLRDAQRQNGNGPSGVYSLGIVQPQRKRDQQRMQKIHTRRDEHGAFTLVGRRDTFAHADHDDSRRKWLAGISAQRGF